MEQKRIDRIKNSIFKLLNEVREEIGIEDELTMDTEPTQFGIKSQILVTIIGRLENQLNVSIPLNCYPFYDKKDRKKLNLNEASIKLSKIIYKYEPTSIIV